MIYRVDFSKTKIFREKDFSLPPTEIFAKIHERATLAEELWMACNVFGTKNNFTMSVFETDSWGNIIGKAIKEAGGSRDDMVFFKKYAESHGAHLVFRALVETGYDQ